jgi:hypothetical protein
MGGKPMMLGEEQRFKASYRSLSTKELKMGDILVVKDFGGPFESGLDSFAVRSSQALFSHVRGGSAFSEHCILFARDEANDPVNDEITVEAISTGVTVRQEVDPRQHLVYRFRGGDHAVRELMRMRAVEVGMTLAGRNGGRKLHYAGVNVGPLGIPTKKALVSFFRSQKRGRFANAHLDRLYDGVYGSGGQVPKVRMICSEFVATCYELAARYLWHQNQYPYEYCLGIDPRAMTAKALEAALNARSNLFRIVGRYQGVGGNLFISGPMPQAGT